MGQLLLSNGGKIPTQFSIMERRGNRVSVESASKREVLGYTYLAVCIQVYYVIQLINVDVDGILYAGYEPNGNHV